MLDPFQQLQPLLQQVRFAGQQEAMLSIDQETVTIRHV